MRRPKPEVAVSSPVASSTALQFLAVASLVYFLFVCFEFPSLSNKLAASPAGPAGGGGFGEQLHLDVERGSDERAAPSRPSKLPRRAFSSSSLPPDLGAPLRRSPSVSLLDLSHLKASQTRALSSLDHAAADAWEVGQSAFAELKSGKVSSLKSSGSGDNRTTPETCPHSTVLTGEQFGSRGNVVELPCGMTLGSHITLAARPRPAHAEYDPKITALHEGEQAIMVSQFMMELQGLKTVDGEDPPRILHFNPRLRGDWSGKPVIEQNTCYRMQWGVPLRCEGWKSLSDEETVDGLAKCEKWIRGDDNGSRGSKTSWWLSRLIGHTKKVSIDWPFPFIEGRLFVLTLSAGLEGYHIHVDGRHITSFPYRTGFGLEDATGLSVNGDIDIVSVFVGSLPTTHPSFAPQGHLDMSPQWQAPPLPAGPVEFFIGILSAGNHFAERMAVRKTWMSAVRKSSNVVARFFVALHGRAEVNQELMREADYFGDIVIVPFMDSYDLVVLKTIAICEYGVRVISAKYVMKCDDDTFVRLDSVLAEVRRVPSGRRLYIGNMNYFHRPLREGKWAVTYEEWPEEIYPAYANGPGYVISADIARSIISDFEVHKLRLFKMEDVSMGMWVSQFANTTASVEYIHSLKFCQFGCIDDYYTAHYQSPRQMVCLWDKLLAGRPQCCNVR